MYYMLAIINSIIGFFGVVVISTTSSDKEAVNIFLRRVIMGYVIILLYELFFRYYY